MKTFLVVLLSLLITVRGIAENEQHKKLAMLRVLDNFDAFQENDIEDFGMPSWTSARHVVASVDSFGAVGDGASDDSQAFLSAWSKACSTPKSVFKVPEGRRYLVNATRFRGPCKTGLRLQIYGTIVAPEKPEDWDPSLSHIWLEFSNLIGVIFEGSGVMDGSGSQCIGSLGKNNSTGIVSKVVLSGAYIRNTMNGLRIKTWQGGSGYVNTVRFENVKMENVENPIIIDQFYCDSPDPCTNLTSAVHISQIMYRNIAGTTKSKEAMKFSCSDIAPCKNIELTNIDLQKEDGTAETFCNSATGIWSGLINPPADCLTETKIIRFGESTLAHTEL